MATPWIAFVSISSWLLFLQVGQSSPDEKVGKQSKQPKSNSVQEQASESQQSNTKTQNDQQDAPITAKAGKYVIKVTKTDAIDQMKLGIKPSSNQATNMLLDHLQSASNQNSSNNIQRNEQFFGGNGISSGRSGGTSGGFSRGSSSTSGSVTNGGNGEFVRPNIAVALEVDSSEKGIIELENMKAVDDKGAAVLWMGPSAFNFYDPNFEKDLNGEIVAYFQEENATEYLTITGDLKVTPGRRIEMEFPNGKPSTKKIGQHTFVLKDVQSNENGIHVTLSLPQLTKKRGNQFGNAQAMLRAVLEQHGAFEVMIQDTNGVLHSPGASGSAGGSSSGSGGGSGSNGGSFREDSHSESSQSFTFGGLPYGREIKSIIVRATEKTGKPLSYPFELQNVPVPYGTN